MDITCENHRIKPMKVCKPKLTSLDLTRESLLADFEQLLTGFKAKASEFSVAQADHFEEIRRQIDIRRESLIQKINNISQEMIRKVELSEQVFRQSTDLDADLEQDLSDGATSLDSLHVLYDAKLAEFQTKIGEFEAKKEALSNYGFQSYFNFESDTFGFLNLNEKFQNLITCSSHDVYISELDRDINVWNLNTNAIEKTLSGHQDMVFCLEIYQKTKLISGSGDKTVKVWDLKTCECLKTLHGHTEEVRCIKLLQNGILASGSMDNTIKIWDLASGVCLATLQGHDERIQCLEQLPNLSLVSGSSDSSLKVWDLPSGECVKSLHGHTDIVLCVKLLTNCRMASGSYDKSIKVWNYVNGECVLTLKGHSNSVTCLEWLGSRDQLISCSHDTTIKMWDLSGSGACVHTLYGHISSVYCIKLNLDEKLVSGSYNGSIKIWDLTSGRCVQTLTGNTFVGDLQLCTI